MLWQKGRRSDNVDIATGGNTGSGGGGGFNGRGLGLGGIVLLAIAGMIFFKNPMALLGGDGGQGQSQAPTATTQPVTQRAGDDLQVDFVKAILGDTEDVWGKIFSDSGRTYERPHLVLFQGRISTACGSASTAVGPFYCPGDHKVYLDLSFFDELQRRFHASGDFARAYVIAHEVGHHVQQQLGIFAKVDQARRRGATLQGASGLSVRQELQADCFAGVWANHAQARNQWLQPGDLETALNAASQIGDDTLQRETQGEVVPDSFTHGTSAQRVHWFKTGFESGETERCNTFSGEI